MKYSVKYFFFLLLMSIAQFGVSQNMFSKTYSDSYQQRYADIIESDNNGFIFSKYTDNLFAPGVITTIKIDSNGNKIDSEIVDDNINFDRRPWVNSMIRLSNGKLCQIYPKDGNKVILQFFDDELNSLGAKQFTKPYPFYLGGLYQINDSTIFITGIKHASATEKNSFIFNTDLQGNERWTKDYGDPSVGDRVSVLFNTNNKLVLVGYQYNTSGDPSLHIIEMNYYGIVTKDTVLSINNLFDIGYHPDYGFYGYTRVKTGMPQPYNRYYVHKFKSDYSFEWTKEMFPDSLDTYYLGKMIIGNQGEVTLAGTFLKYINGDPKQISNFFQINSKGDVLQNKTIMLDSANSSTFDFLQSTSDNGFILVGTATIGLYIYRWITKVNTQGCFTQSCIVSVPEMNKPQGELTCYPNPSNGIGTVKGSFKTANSTNQIKVFNSLGLLVFSKTITTKEFDIEVSLPSSGLYLVNLYQGDRMVKSLKWVVK